MKNFLFLQPSALGAKVVAKDFGGVPDAVLNYVALNIFLVLKIDSINSGNLHHIIDGLVALRKCTYSLGLERVTGNLNYCLDYISELLPDVEGGDKYKYRKSAEYDTENVNNDIINDLAGMLKIEKIPQLANSGSFMEYYLDFNEDYNREKLLSCGTYRGISFTKEELEQEQISANNNSKIPEEIQKLIERIR